MKSEKARIGEGVYTAADAARIMRIPYPKAKYWFDYYAKGRLIEDTKFQYYFPVRDIIAVNFLTLMEMFVFYKLKERGVSTRQIREAHSVMAKQLNTPYPFATEGVIAMGKKGLYFKHETDLTQASVGLQLALPQVVIPFSEKIEFSNGLVSKYYPLGKKKTVVVNPNNQFGQPVIEGTNILVETIDMLHKGKERISSICELYGISKQNVRDAVAFCKAA